MIRPMWLAAASLLGATLATGALAQTASPDVPAGQGANLTVRGAVPSAASTPPAATPFHFAGNGASGPGGISAGALSGPLGSPSAATSCRPAVRHVVHRRVVHRAVRPLVVASLPPPPVIVYRPLVPVYRPYLVPIYRPFVVGYGGFYGGPRFYRGGGFYGYRGRGFYR